MANAVNRKMQTNSRVSPSLASPAFWAKIKMQGYRLVRITAASPAAQLFRCPRSVFMGQRPPKFRTSSVTAFSAFLSTPARKFVTLYFIIHSLICNHNFHRFHTFYCIMYKNAIGILCNVHRTRPKGQVRIAAHSVLSPCSGLYPCIQLPSHAPSPRHKRHTTVNAASSFHANRIQVP